MARTLQNAAGANGNGASLAVTGAQSVGFSVSGTFNATVNFEGTVDGGTNWISLPVRPANLAGTVTATTVVGSFIASAAGLSHVRARISGWSSGTVTVAAQPGAGQAGLPPALTRSFFQAMGTAVAISVKGTPGSLLSLSVTSINAAIRYVQVHNKASAPATNDVPILSIPISAGSATAATRLALGASDFGEAGFPCSVGVAIGISTTAATYTAATATDHHVSGSFV